VGEHSQNTQPFKLSQGFREIRAQVAKAELIPMVIFFGMMLRYDADDSDIRDKIKSGCKKISMQPPKVNAFQ